jgi:hypothetical protein
VCCATERMIELACPEHCQFLISAREQAKDREIPVLLKQMNETDVVPRMTDRTWAAMFMVGGAIVSVQRGLGAPALRDLSDSEILEAVENTSRNLETEESGLIYEHHVASPRVDAVRRKIRESFEESSKRLSSEERLRRSEILTALKFARIAVKSHLQREGDGRSYLRYLCLHYPWPDEASRPLIV